MSLALLLVRQQDVGQHETFSAGVTRVRTFSVVRLSVNADVPGRGESFLTYFTGEPLLVGVAAGLADLAAWRSVGQHGPRRGGHHVEIGRRMSSITTEVFFG